MSEEDTETLYRYTIPIEVEDGVEQPAYESSADGKTYQKSYEANEVIIVQDEPTPHFHKDEVNVGVEEVNKEEYLNG